MTKAEIVDEIVKNTGIERVKVQSIVEGFMECVIKSLSEGENVYFHNFGTFKVKTRAKRNSRDISRAKTVVVPARNVPAFKPVKAFLTGPLNQGVARVVIPDSETEIPSFAFQGHSDLTTVTIGKSVMQVGNFAFQGCENLADVDIPDSVKIIGNNAFQGCTSLAHIDLPASVTEIRRFAFAGCESLSSIVIPDQVTKIRRYTFAGCKNLTSVVLPDSVTEIGLSAFSGCTELKSVVFGNSVKKISENAFAGCTSLTSIVLPDSVTKIGGNAFSGCTSLTSVVIGNAVKQIGNSAFRGCESLKSLVLGHSVKTIGERAFWECYSLKRVTIPASVTELGKEAFLKATRITLETDSSLTIRQGGLKISFADDLCYDEGILTVTRVVLRKTLKDRRMRSLLEYMGKYPEKVIITEYDLDRIYLSLDPKVNSESADDFIIRTWNIYMLEEEEPTMHVDWTFHIMGDTEDGYFRHSTHQYDGSDDIRLK